MEPVTIILIALPLMGALASAWYKHTESKKVKKFLSIIIEATSNAPVDKAEIIKSIIKPAMQAKDANIDFKKIVAKIEKKL